MSRHVKKLVFFTLTAAACSSTPARTTPSSPAPGPSSTTEPSAADATPKAPPPADPDVIRCGVDDSPVPVGALELDATPGAMGGPLGAASLLGFGAAAARLIALPPAPGGTAALPSVTFDTVATPTEPTIATDAFAQAFGICSDFAAPPRSPDSTAAIAGATTVTRLALTFGATGAPATARLAGAQHLADAPKLARCLVERACSLPPATGRAKTSAELTVTATLSPPVFTGTVEAEFRGNEFSQQMHLRTHGFDRGFEAVPARPGSEAVKKLLKDAATACAKRLPPGDRIRFEHGAELTGGKPPLMGRPGPAAEHARVLAMCIQEELQVPLTKPIAGRGMFVIGLDINPHQRPEPTGGKK